MYQIQNERWRMRLKCVVTTKIKSREKCARCGRFITIYLFWNCCKTLTFQNKNKKGGSLLQILDVDAVNESVFSKRKKRSEASFVKRKQPLADNSSCILQTTALFRKIPTSNNQKLHILIQISLRIQERRLDLIFSFFRFG